MMIQRFFHRYGFGIQSPWAYSLVRNVLFEPLRYYAFDELQAKHAQCSKTERKRNEQLFRIVNHFKPQKIEIVGNTVASTRDYLSFQTSSANSQLSTFNTQLFYYICPSAPISSIPKTLSDGMLLVIDDICETNKAAWKQLTANAQVTAIFDMQYRGLLCCDTKRIRQTYLL